MLPSYYQRFIDGLEIGKIPGIGFKTARLLREYVLQRASEYDGLEPPKEDVVLVADLKAIEDISASVIEKILSGPGTPHGIGRYIMNLLNGIDNSEVARARDLPKQISIEDSYGGIDNLEAATQEMIKLATSLIKRIRIDLLESPRRNTAPDGSTAAASPPRWLGRPKVLRLSTRHRTAQNDKRLMYSSRISRTGAVPAFLLTVNESADDLATRLVRESLLPLFKKLHPAKPGWNLSLINVAVANIEETGSETKGAVGRDIGHMFRTQEATLKEWQVYDTDLENSTSNLDSNMHQDTPMQDVGDFVDTSEGLIFKGSEDDIPWSTQRSQNTDDWIEDDSTSFDEHYLCPDCGASMPSFAMGAHERFHENGD